MKLTQKLIEKMPFPEKGQKFVFDDDLPGFGIRLSQATKTFFVQGFVNSKKIRITIGKVPVFNLARARQRAKDHLHEMALGNDPRSEKKRIEAESTTLGEVVESYIMDRRLKKNTIHDIHKHLKGVFSSWKDRPFVSINRDMVLSRFREFSERSHAQANQAFRILRALLNYAQATYRPGDRPLIIENPVKVLSDAKMWHYIPPREKNVPLNEIGNFWHKLQKARHDPAQTISGRSVVDAVCFCLLTGARREEVASLKWEHINFESETWRIDDPKNNRPVTLPLSQQTIDILSARPRENEFVFFSDKSATGHIGAGAIRNKAYALQKIAAHDLRRTFQAIGGACNIELFKIKLLMNHRQKNDVTITHYMQTSDLSFLKSEIYLIGNYVERKALLFENQVIELSSVRRH